MSTITRACVRLATASATASFSRTESCVASIKAALAAPQRRGMSSDPRVQIASEAAREALTRSSESKPRLIRSSPALGAEVVPANLSSPLSPETRKTIQRGLDKFSVLVFKNQNVTGHQLVDHLKFLGPVATEQHYVDQGLTLEGCPECFVLRNDANNPPLFDFWHSDKTAWKLPARYTVLLCKEIPEVGGDTLISNNRKAFERMSEGTKRIFRHMHGVYNEKQAFLSNPKIVKYLQNKGFSSEGVYDHFVDQTHPIVRRNPRNGKEAIYFSPPYFSHMKGFTKEESLYYQRILARAIAIPELIYRHSWTKGDVVIIDNSATSHYAVADFFPNEREMHRITITEVE
ncbi:MAG: TauD/TfdA family dioxygenase [Simkaniaceae bacterium]|nr:TauD/TfdA family dioxygenase [Candidatus Sacchlamyda saccharinae]